MPLYTAIRTYFCTTGAYQGIKTAFNNSHRGWDAFKSGFMHATNGLYVLDRARSAFSPPPKAPIKELFICKVRSKCSTEKDFYTQRCFKHLADNDLPKNFKVPIAEMALFCGRGKLGGPGNYPNPFTRCYRDLSRKWNPDKQGGDKSVFQTLGLAHATLQAHYKV